MSVTTDMIGEYTPLQEIKDAKEELTILFNKLDELYKSGRRRVVSATNIAQYRFMAKSALGSVDFAIRKLEKLEKKCKK